MPKLRKIQPPSRGGGGRGWGRPPYEPEFDDDDDYDENDGDEFDEDDEDEFDEGYGNRWTWYAASQPIRPADGIKARNQRGAFGSSWWAKSWIAALEQFNWGTRLQRGRTYARSGQVLSIELSAGTVKSKVQGSRPKPYDVTIAINPLSDAQWEQVIDALAEQAIFAAKLLAGEMPQDIEEAFTAVGVPLFPERVGGINATCSCPDYANPCKHIAAVYYLLGERFDDDPFLIFHLRGRTRTQIIAALRARRAASTSGSFEAAPTSVEPVPVLADLLATFFQAGPALDDIAVHIAAPEIEAARLKQLGAPPASTDTDLRAFYRALTAKALERTFGGGE